MMPEKEEAVINKLSSGLLLALPIVKNKILAVPGNECGESTNLVLVVGWCRAALQVAYVCIFLRNNQGTFKLQETSRFSIKSTHSGNLWEYRPLNQPRDQEVSQT